MLEFHCIDSRTTTKILYMNTLRTYSSTVWGSHAGPPRDHAGILPRATSQSIARLDPTRNPLHYCLGITWVQTQIEQLERALRFV